jgi:NTE family protein
MIVDVNANIPYYKPVFTEIPRQEKEFSFKRKAFRYLRSNLSFMTRERSNYNMKINYLSVLDKTFDVMQDKICNLTISQGKPEWDIDISRDAASTFEFYKAQELIEAGRCAYHISKKNTN